ncbi:MAG: hypothetical protein V4787_02230 [Pseudomonadota bacterium]
MTTQSAPTPFSITKTDTSILVKAPFNPSFNAQAKSQLGARFKDERWVFDARDETAARRLVLERYGYADSEVLVSVRVTVADELKECQDPIVRLGRVIAEATGRDSGARLGDGVRLESGAVKSGGSTKNWTTVIADGTVLVVHDVPMRMAKIYLNEPGRNGLNVEIVGGVSTLAENSTLWTERAKLLARVAEIDAALAEATTTVL